jgi:magnesium-transporting ATPase (P-type)/class 3 adenylate cyclase
MDSKESFVPLSGSVGDSKETPDRLPSSSMDSLNGRGQYTFSGSIESIPMRPISFKKKEIQLQPELELRDSAPPRRIKLGDLEHNQEFPHNAVTTSKYTAYNFVFKNLLEQFRRVANIYFLIISILQVFTDLSPTSRYNTIGPLMLVLLVTMVKECFEDYQRHKGDVTINHSTVHVLREGVFKDVYWKDMYVGDIVRVKNKESIPADFILLGSSSPKGACYIETSNLDGETNLKLRQAIPHMDAYRTAAQFEGLRGEVECGAPNADLYSFRGVFERDDGTRIPVNLDNVVWRGCRLKNTNYVYGLVVYTGQETKLIMNSRRAPAKRSNVEKSVDKAIILIFVTLALLCSIGTVLHANWLETKTAEGATYLDEFSTETTLEIGTTWITFLILFNNLVPISLYVSLELCKLLQARLIEADIKMYHAESDTPALARTSNLNEDLGQVEYVFSDKTGTLTCNEMEFTMCSVGGVLYGSPPDNHYPADLPTPRLGRRKLKSRNKKKQTQSTLSDLRYNINTHVAANAATGNGGDGDGDGSDSDIYDQKDDNDAASSSQSRGQVFSLDITAASGISASAAVSTPKNTEGNDLHQLAVDSGRSARTPRKQARKGMSGYNFDDDVFRQHLRLKNVQGDRVREFTSALALCHTVMPERDDETAELHYQSASPDEGALVAAARYIGYEFNERRHDTITINQDGTDIKYGWLNVNEFSSNRKRMSVVVRKPNGKIVMYCKGADDVMIPLLNKNDPKTHSTLKNHLFQFASDGLRTLVIAYKELDKDLYEDWNARYLDAMNTIDGREDLLQDLATEIEVGMELLGATAIEDKLQDGVPETIERLTRAGMKVWMLTGDKLETAENIGHSCHLLTPTIELIRLDEDSGTATALILARSIIQHQSSLGKSNKNLALIVSGRSLAYVFGDKRLRTMFLELIKICGVVIACRVIPSQKANIVRLVRKKIKHHPITLAIGDGANDVAMIQEAHVGVGISGNEGMQAVRSSDYAFSQFRFLQRLLLVHGRWNYRRVSFLILYSFYKNIANVLTLFYFCFHNGFTGTTLYESWLGTGWNVGWTVFPVLVFGFMEQDISAKTALANPHVYVHGQRHREFNIPKMAIWVANAFVHSAVIYIVSYYVFDESFGIGTDGRTTDLFLMGTMINMCTVLVVNYKIALETHYWTVVTCVAFVGSIVIWVLFVAIYSNIIDLSTEFFGVGSALFKHPSFYMLIIFVPITAILFDLCFHFLKVTYFPSPYEIVQELESLARTESKATGKPMVHDFTQHPEISENPLPEHFHISDASSIGGGSMIGSMIGNMFGGTVGRSTSMTQRFGMARVSTLHDRNALITNHVDHLQQVLAGDQSAIEAPKEIVEQTKAVFSDEVKMCMDPITLRFRNYPDLEDEFQSTYAAKSLAYVRVAMTVVFFFMVGYTVFSVFVEDLAVARIVGTAAAMCALAVVYTRLFRRYFHTILFLILLGAGASRTLLVTTNGSIGMGMFAIIAFLVTRSRFVWAMIVVIVDWVFYNLYVSSKDLFSAFELIKIDYLHLCIVMFCGYVSYHQEQSFRFDFLLQQDHKLEQQRTQIITDNILPNYITKQLKKRRQRDWMDTVNVNKLNRRFSEIFKAAQSNGMSFSSVPNSNTSSPPQHVRNISDSPMDQQAPTVVEDVIAQEEPSVTILFCDIVRFMDYVKTHRPTALVAVLDAVYSTFDELCAKNGVQKMETVGKTYMACAGLQGTRRDHAHACAELAQDMISYMSKCVDVQGEPLSLRIGIHSGRAISGVVGVNRQQFSLFGDTVNTASRMQSTGTINRIHLSPVTHEKLAKDYDFEPNTVMVKGKGTMNTYYLGERITRANPMRSYDLVKYEADVEIIDEALDLIRRKSVVADYNPYEMAQAELSVWSLRFKNSATEESYMAHYRQNVGQFSRRSLSIAILLFAVEAIFELLDDDTDLSGNDKLTIALSRYGYVGLSALLWLFTHTHHFCMWAAAYNTFVFGLGMAASIVVPLTIDDTLGNRAALRFIFNMTLLSTSATLRFLPNVLINVLGAAAWSYASFVEANTSVEGAQHNDQIAFLIFVCAGAFVNLVASYGREFYYRREFLLSEQVFGEKEYAEAMLYSMLPEPVAKQLRAGKLGVAEEFSQVTILYSDIKGFTKYSASSSPENVVTLLHSLFRQFDRLCKVHAVYKVQTIGDAYVLVGGLPFMGDRSQIAEPAEHADNVINMAMDMHEVIFTTRTMEGDRVWMRIGIHSGTIIAGCIGTKQLRYDIWGSDPLLANSMESNGIPGGIVISDATYQYVKPPKGQANLGKYSLVPHANVEFGGESIKTYAIEHPTADANRRFCTHPEEFEKWAAEN